MKYIKIDSDNWDDVGKVWLVLEQFTKPTSTACQLILEDTSTKEVTHRVVSSHQIEWL